MADAMMFARRWFQFLILALCLAPGAAAADIPVTPRAQLEARLKALWGRVPADALPTADYVTANGKLPPHYITKGEAAKRGWHPGSDLSQAAPGKMIGGDVFGNRERALPAARGRTYREADIGYKSGKRNAMRLVFSNDGLVFFTDHYNQWVRVK
jgi:hypothetical protein